MELKLHKFVLKLKHTFSISRESHDVQDTLIVALSLNGHTGYGEATSNPYYGITIESMTQEISRLEEGIREYAFTNPEDFYQFLTASSLSNFSICALDQAANDLYGKILGKPLYKIWNTEMTTYPKTNYTIGIDTIEKMVLKMKEVAWPIYKIKLGTDHDVEIVKALRKNSDALFRVDANCAWSPEETLRNAHELKNLGVEFIEQPLKADNLEGYRMIFGESPLPLIADESCIYESDVEKCAGLFHGINIKLVKCGGLTPARRMIQKARSLNLKVMVGCMTESTVGTSAIAQLLPQLDYVDMDGPLLITNDIADGVKILPDATLQFPEIAGSGVMLHP